MRASPEGLVPAKGFMQEAMIPRPSFNDGTKPGEPDFPFIILFQIYFDVTDV